MTSCFGRPRVQPSMTSVKAAAFFARAGGVLKRPSRRNSGRPMISVIVSNGCALSGGSIR